MTQDFRTDSRLDALPTPCLILDEAKMQANIDRLAAHAKSLGVTLRPHLKTGKSVEVAQRVLDGGTGPATVSTLTEAEQFAAAGIHDIIYAVGIAPHKLTRVAAIRETGCDLVVILDSVAQAEAVAQFDGRIPALIEIDSDGHRGGLTPDNPDLISIGQILHNSAELRGVITHAGESYDAVGQAAQAEFAERERSAAVRAAERLKEVDLPCPVVSVGSTPTAHAARDLSGVTELRAGVYVFFDLVMAGIGVCRPEDIALSVLCTVIGHQRDRGWILVDAGWMAMSRDRGTANQEIDQGFGMVCDSAGNILPDLIIASANQEHGVVALRSGSSEALPDLPVGTRLRILPNHACATGAQHDSYQVVPKDPGEKLQVWTRFRGW